MFYQNDYVTMNIRKQQTDEYLREAEKERLLAGLNPRQPNRLLQVAGRMLRGIGRLLLATGRQLDQIETSQPSESAVSQRASGV